MITGPQQYRELLEMIHKTVAWLGEMKKQLYQHWEQKARRWVVERSFAWTA